MVRLVRGVTNRALGTGNTIGVALDLLPADAAAGEATYHRITVVATGAGGLQSRPASTEARIQAGLS